MNNANIIRTEDQSNLREAENGVRLLVSYGMAPSRAADIMSRQCLIRASQQRALELIVRRSKEKKGG